MTNSTLASTETERKRIGEAVRQSERQLEGILEERLQTRMVAGDATQALLEAEREHEGPTLMSVGSRGLGVGAACEAEKRLHQRGKGRAGSGPGIRAFG